MRFERRSSRWSPRRVALTALKGMAGIGKTVLAQALCLDEVMQAAFPDGIIWIPIGKDPRDIVLLLREAARAIGDSLDGYDNSSRQAIACGTAP